jgi:putative spermidine/putrescine transport system permease protein
MSARLPRFLAWLFLALVYVFALAPAAVILIDSFNSAMVFPAPFESATLRWYAGILRHEEFVASMRMSAMVATAAAIVATTVGVLAAYALIRYPVPGTNAIATFLLGPLLVPQIVIGLAMLQLIGLAGLRIGLLGLILVHAVYVLPFTLRLVMTSLTRFDFLLEDAARSLGASRLRTLWHVTLPLIRPGLVSGFVFAFILSFVNLPVSLFLTSPQTATLPIVMFAYIESRIDPLVTAVSAVVLFVAVSVMLLLERGFRIRLLG